MIYQFFQRYHWPPSDSAFSVTTHRSVRFSPVMNTRIGFEFIASISLQCFVTDFPHLLCLKLYTACSNNDGHVERQCQHESMLPPCGGFDVEYTQEKEKQSETFFTLFQIVSICWVECYVLYVKYRLWFCFLSFIAKYSFYKRCQQWRVIRQFSENDLLKLLHLSVFSHSIIFGSLLFFPLDLKKKEKERKKRMPCKDTINL